MNNIFKITLGLICIFNWVNSCEQLSIINSYRIYSSEKNALYKLQIIRRTLENENIFITLSKKAYLDTHCYCGLWINQPHANTINCYSHAKLEISVGQKARFIRVPLKGDPNNFILVHLKTDNHLAVIDRKSGNAIMYEIIFEDTAYGYPNLKLIKEVWQFREFVKQKTEEFTAYNKA